jgi:hypothetical protein
VYGDGLAALARPAVDESIDFDKLTTMDELNEAERRLGSG